MRITTTVNVILERADGSVSECSERVVETSFGDNPRYDVDSVGKTIEKARERVLAAVQAGRQDQLTDPHNA